MNLDSIAEKFRLTERERQVVGELARARNHKQIADKLGISFHTVMFHKRAIYRKFNVHFAAEFFLKIYLHGNVAARLGS